MRKLEAKELVLATHNDGKLREIRDLLAPFGFAITSAGELGLPEPVEDGTTFEENAYIKAHAAALATGKVALSDDSGLCVDALGGAPGIYTADWAEKDDGSGRDFMMAMKKVEAKLKDGDNRSASFNATLCLCWPDGHSEYFVGRAPGQLVWPPRGGDGFGYDPVFQPEGHTRTFGEMTAQEKHGWRPGQAAPPLSHRARAFAQLAEHLDD